MNPVLEQTLRVRTLDVSDALPYRELMLEAYVQAADAFTTTAEERASEPESWWVKRIAHPLGLSACFGAEIEGRLVGTVALESSAKPKKKHSALLIGMYVRPDSRGKGIGRSLLDAALRHATGHAEVQVVTLTVTEGNEHALRLYRDAGFVSWGTQPLAIATPSGLKGKVHMSRTLASDAMR